MSRFPGNEAEGRQRRPPLPTGALTSRTRLPRRQGVDRWENQRSPEAPTFLLAQFPAARLPPHFPSSLSLVDLIVRHPDAPSPEVSLRITTTKGGKSPEASFERGTRDVYISPLCPGERVVNAY